MITSISWKNVWRNKTRSSVVIVAVILGTVAGVFVAGLMNGALNQKIDAAIYTEVGHYKIQNPDYLINEEARHYIKDLEKLKSYLDTAEHVGAYAMRSKIMAVATTARGTSGIMLKGIDISKEKKVSELYTKVLPNTGSYFETKSKLPPVLISNKTAELLKIKNYRITDNSIDSLKKLEVPDELITKVDALKGQRFITKKKFEKAIRLVWKENEIETFGYALIKTAAYFQPRARVTFTFTKTNGQIGYQTYQVCGVFKSGNGIFDQMSAFVKNTDLHPAVGLNINEVHEISVLVNDDSEKLSSITNNVAKIFPNQNIMTWKELAPDAGMMAEFMQIYYYIIMGIIFFALSFGIINTMLMAILERIKELGMLMAIGMKKLQVFAMIMLETIFLTLTGSVLGMLLGGLLINLTGKSGLNFSSFEEGFEAMGWSSVVYPKIEISFFFGITLMVIVVAIISSIIPARKALKLKPVEAIKIE